MSELVVSINLRLAQLFTVLRLIDFRITALRSASLQASQQDINEAVDLTKLRMVIQERVNVINAGC